MGAGGVLPTLRRQFNDMSRSPVMAGDFTSANDRKFHMFHTSIHRKEQLLNWCHSKGRHEGYQVLN